MKVRELLRILREDMLHDHSARVPDASDDDRLWSDATLVRYIDEAQRRFARRSLILRDATTPEATRLKLVAGQAHYKLHQSVLAVVSAKFANDVGDLTRAGHSMFSTAIAPDMRVFDPAYFSSLPDAKPIVYTTDEEIARDDDGFMVAPTMRLYPTPSAAFDNAEVRLRVVRLPLDRLSPTLLDMEPEVPEDYQIDMLDWAAYLALRIVDLDQEAPARAEKFAASFEAHVKAARQELMRKVFTPTHWGFGRGGWGGYAR